MEDMSQILEEAKKLKEKKQNEGGSGEGGGDGNGQAQPNVLDSLTDEQVAEIIQKKYGVSPDKLVVKQEEPETPEQIEERNKAERQKAVAEGLSKGWFTQEAYDKYLQMQVEGKTAIARAKFKKDNPELGEDADDVFDDVFAINESDTLEPFEEGEEPRPNKKKKVAEAILGKVADQYLNEEFESVIKVEETYKKHKDKEKLVQTNLALIQDSLTEIPRTLSFKIKEEEYSYKISDEDIQEVSEVLKSDEVLITGKGNKKEDIIQNSLLLIKAKKLNEIIEEISEARLTKERESYERGQKGLIPGRENSEGGAAAPLTDGQKLVQEIMNRK